MDYPQLRLHIDGQHVGLGGRQERPVIDPATEKVLAPLPVATSDDIDAAICAAARAFPDWRNTAPWQRGVVLHEAALRVRNDLEKIARTLVLENGKPISEARAEIAATADTLDWYAGEAQRIYGRISRGRGSGTRFVTALEPVGVVALFSPWNFPAITFMRKLAPALAAGCAVVAKPAEETPATPLLLASCLEAAGLPAGVLNIVFGEPATISSHLVNSPIIRKISFTGSTTVGRYLASLAGGALKRMTLELGGHAPVIVCGDVDAVQAASLAAAAKFRNAGQVCNAASRFIVHRRVYEAFVEQFAAAAGSLRIGNGLDPDTQMGPLSNVRRRQAMEAFTEDALRHGARLVTAGTQTGNEGFFFRPTVLADVPPEAKIMKEEPFGPIAPLIPFERIEDAIAMANGLTYGLAGYVLTNDLKMARYVTDRLEVGIIGLNTFAAAFPETPFGGVKDSGWGTEGGPDGMLPYLVTKFVHEA